MVEKLGPCACQPISEDELYLRLEQIIAEYQAKPGALIPVLQMAQGVFGYLPEPVLKKISLGLNKPYSEVAGVVGFYSFFSTHPRGKHMIRVCLGTACYVRGGKRILEVLKQKLGIDVGETTSDRMFFTGSGPMFRWPAVLATSHLQYDDDGVYQRVKPTKIQEILDQYRQKDSAEPARKDK